VTPLAGAGRWLIVLCLLAAASSTSAGLPVDPIAAAVNHPARSKADRVRDLTSKPAAVLEFLAVQPGMVVVDLLGGDGYYSEILARIVGPGGRVYLHNNQGYAGLMRKVPRRLKGPGMEALEVYVREVGDINLPSESVDLVLMVKVYHDLYYLNNGWSVSPEGVFRTVHRILKPGGVLAVIDHRAPDGSGAAYAQNLHRIAEDFARQDIESRGFRLDGRSKILRNPGDDLNRSVFEADLRGRTDRFLHRYRKTGATAPSNDQPSMP
jgi:predicted methyltransferase